MSVLLNQEAEVTTVAAILRNPESYWMVNDIGLSSKDFLGPNAAKVFRAIQIVAGDRRIPEFPLVIEELDESVHEYANKLLSTAATIPQAVEAAKVVKGLATSRQLQTVGAEIIGIAEEHRADSEAAVAEAESLLRNVRNTLPMPDRSPDPADIIRRINSPVDDRSTRIRFSPMLDAMVGGLHPGHLWVIGGFSSTGKSAAVVNFVADALKQKKNVAVFSLEMTQEQYIIRLLSVGTGIGQREIKDRVFIGHEQVEMMRLVEGRLASAPLRIYDTSYRLPDIRSKAIQTKETMGLDIMVVDFIQNVYVEGDEISDARATILELQNMAKELDTTVIALSQVSNEMAKWEGDKNFYSFKGHGAIRDAADVGVMLKRDRLHTPGIMDFTVVKHRHGDMGNIPMHFDLKTGRLSDAPELVDTGDDD